MKWWGAAAVLVFLVMMLPPSRPAQASFCTEEEGTCYPQSYICETGVSCSTSSLWGCGTGKCCWDGSCSAPIPTPKATATPTPIPPTPTPTPAFQTCTGRTDCKVETELTCRCASDTSKECPTQCPGQTCVSQMRQRCGPPNLVYCPTNYEWMEDTSCSSVPPLGCPTDRSECTWYPSWDCGGGSCDDNERRTAALYCNELHCDDACLTDSSCGGGGGGGGGGGCSMTAPTNLVVTRLSSTRSRLDWAPGTDVTSQRLYIGANSYEVTNGCPGYASPTCVVKEETLGPTRASFTTGNVLTTGTLYYYRVVGFESASCPTLEATTKSLSSCPLSPASASISVGSSYRLTSNVYGSPDIVKVNFSAQTNATPGGPKDPPEASVSPVSDKTYSYTTWVTGERIYEDGAIVYDTTASGDVYLTGQASSNCSGTASVTVVSPDPWVQTTGGDVSVAGSIISKIPATASPRVFARNGASGYPGVVTYGTSFDFAPGSGTGASYVSTTDWLVNGTYPEVDYYTYFWRRFGAPTTTDNHLFPDLQSVSQPASRATPYYIVGDLKTSGDWNITSGGKVMFIIDGQLTLGGEIKRSGTGFVAFIVNGDITISSQVGVAADSSTAVLSGLYITSPTGTFTTSASTASATERLVGKGIFIAGSFALERDLSQGGGDENYTTAAELFVYDPQLLLTMPEKMKEVPLTWQEVAP